MALVPRLLETVAAASSLLFETTASSGYGASYGSPEPAYGSPEPAYGPSDPAYGASGPADGLPADSALQGARSVSKAIWKIIFLCSDIVQFPCLTTAQLAWWQYKSYSALIGPVSQAEVWFLCPSVQDGGTAAGLAGLQPPAEGGRPSPQPLRYWLPQLGRPQPQHWLHQLSPGDCYEPARLGTWRNNKYILTRTAEK